MTHQHQIGSFRMPRAFNFQSTDMEQSGAREFWVTEKSVPGLQARKNLYSCFKGRSSRLPFVAVIQHKIVMPCYEGNNSGRLERILRLLYNLRQLDTLSERRGGPRCFCWARAVPSKHVYST